MTFLRHLFDFVLSDSLEVDFILETVKKLIEEHGISLHASTIVHLGQTEGSAFTEGGR
ncbi:hypothetical protein [Robinsoniella peoriensis]|uniref:hypothetical protein n=1 Tax=Robinsoniella peoriensis TaxID=180332 RepID=UPI00364497CD